jgi:DNA-binding IclR family transcriptional regulator
LPLRDQTGRVIAAISINTISGHDERSAGQDEISGSAEADRAGHPNPNDCGQQPAF